MILVVGATGLLGGEVCRRLRAGGHDVRGLARGSSPQSAELERCGVQLVPGDLKEPASLDVACRGVTAVVSTASSTASRRAGDNLQSVDRDGQLALVSAARRAGVRHTVYTSVGPDLSNRPVLVAHKRHVEHAVRASGMEWNVLQPSKFMEVWFSPVVGWDVGAGNLTIFGSGNSPFRYVAISDVARFAVLAIEHPELRNRDLPLGGPTATTENEAARIFEAAVGHPLKRTHVPVVLMRMMSSVLKPLDPIRSTLIAMAVDCIDHPETIDMAELLARFPIHLITVAEFAERWVRTHRSRTAPRAAPARNSA